MESKSIIIGIVSFISGALLVSTAAVTVNKPKDSMNSMIESLQTKTGDEFDKEFIAQMIAHHQGAIDMAKLSENQAQHAEIKELSRNIISAQEKEIAEMKSWQKAWHYEDSGANSQMH
jgi:uncharacterized protein (DUF305 family)